MCEVPLALVEYPLIHPRGGPDVGEARIEPVGRLSDWWVMIVS